MIAIGIGCRTGASKGAITALVAEARARAEVAGERAALFSHERKSSERGLHAAAQALGLPLSFLDDQALRDVEGQIVTRSRASMAATALPCVCEAAALAGAGAGGRLLLARIVGAGVTCAIARSAAP